MKVYFTAAIYQREKLEEEYRAIIKAIQDCGHDVLTSFNIMEEKLDRVLSISKVDHEVYFGTWSKVIKQADVAVVEVSFPSTVHIGMEIGGLIERGKPVICLYQQGRNPTFVEDFHSPRLLKLEYTKDDVKEVLEWVFEEVEQLLNRRFTFFIPPEIDAYLNKMADADDTSRSEYIRNLISKDMETREK